MAKDNHRYLTSNSSNTSVKLSSVKTNYGRNSICFKSCTQWNKIMKELNSEKIRGEKREGKYWNKNRNKCRELLDSGPIKLPNKKHDH